MSNAQTLSEAHADVPHGKENIFQIWKVYQRRADSLAHYFDMDIVYYHFAWEEKSKFHKAASYLAKLWKTFADLVTHRPKLIFLQLPPTPALYLVGAYALLTRTPYICDCHNAMIVDWWIKWPFAKTLLRKAKAVLVHNDDVCKYATEFGMDAMVMRDPLPHKTEIAPTGVVERFGLESGKYVIVPWNLADDEPMAEFIEAVRSLPDIKFAMTWFSERLPQELSHNLPENLVFTSYLEIDEFDDLFAQSGAAISLTTQKGTQPSAAAEAVAFGVPIILTETETAKLLYRDVPALVDNTPESIAEGVQRTFDNIDDYRTRVVEFKEILNRELEEEVEVLRRKIL